MQQEKATAHHSRQQQQDDGHLHYVCHSAFCSKAVGGFDIAKGPKGGQIEQQMQQLHMTQLRCHSQTHC